MQNKTSDWAFAPSASRPALSDWEVDYWKEMLKRTLKVGIEVELNLPKQKGRCDQQNYFCKCISVFEPDEDSKMPETKLCYEQCQNWDGGNCEIAKEEGCVGIHCAAFKSPCGICPKYDRGCSTCSERYDINKDPAYIRELIGRKLAPTRFVGAHGKHGVYKVCRDGSLLGDGGVEIATTGKRVQFSPLYKMIESIMEEAKSHGAYVNERCSIHIHLLASYLRPGFDGNDLGSEFLKDEVTELERPVPEIILANFHQLVRRYQTALVWLSASGESWDHLTRWEKFRKSILPYSTANKSMSVVAHNVGKASGSKRKYAFINYEQLSFSEDGDVARFHIEGRYMDGNLSPATVVSHCVLLYGLLLKAVELSKYGVVYSGNKAYMQLQKEMYASLCNRDGPWGDERNSDTSRIGPFVSNIKAQAIELVRLVKPSLAEESPADYVLQNLAEKPLALRRIDGQSWESIEESLMPQSKERTRLEADITKMIDLGAICECEDSNEWIEAVSLHLGEERGIDGKEQPMDDLTAGVNQYVESLNERRRIFWSSEVGGYVNKQ